MANLNKKCIVCGNEYKYCNSCPSDLNHPSWMSLFDNENCKNIFNTLSAETQGFLTKEDAKNKLLSLDLSEKDRFNEKIKHHISSVLKEENLKSFDEVKQDFSINTSEDNLDYVVEKKKYKTTKIKADSKTSNKK